MVHLQREVENLKKKILQLAAIVEEDVRRAVQSVKDLDIVLASKIVAGDSEIDQIEVEVEEDCLKVFALYQPVAVDLRYIVAILKINNDLERIGDLAVNIAERTPYIAKYPKRDLPFVCTKMSQKAQWMLKKSLDSFVNLNIEAAKAVRAADDDVDAYFAEMHDIVKEGIRSNIEMMDYYIDMLAVARNLERIADHATNIAEDVIYMVEGDIVRHTPYDLLPEG